MNGTTKKVIIIGSVIAGIGLAISGYYYFIYTPPITSDEMTNGTPTAGGGLNNPGNLRTSTVAYQGEVDNQGNAFKWFEDMSHGYRAIIIIYRYYNKYLFKNTLLAMVSTYAPSGDGSNNPSIYAQSLATALGIGINDDISGWIQSNSDPRIITLMKAITKVEQGGSFTIVEDDLATAITLL